MIKGHDKRYFVFEIIHPYDNWYGQVESSRDQEAKEALKRFYEVLKKIKPDRKYLFRENYYGGHFSYLPHMLKIEQAMAEKNYQRVCNALCSLGYYDLFFQARVFYNVLSILEDGL